MYLSAKCLFLFVCFFVTFSGRLSPFPPTPPPPSKEKTLPCKPPPPSPPPPPPPFCKNRLYLKGLFHVQGNVQCYPQRCHHTATPPPTFPPATSGGALELISQGTDRVLTCQCCGLADWCARRHENFPANLSFQLQP